MIAHVNTKKGLKFLTGCSDVNAITITHVIVTGSMESYRPVLIRFIPRPGLGKLRLFQSMKMVTAHIFYTLLGIDKKKQAMAAQCTCTLSPVRHTFAFIWSNVSLNLPDSSYMLTYLLKTAKRANRSKARILATAFSEPQKRTTENLPKQESTCRCSCQLCRHGNDTIHVTHGPV